MTARQSLSEVCKLTRDTVGLPVYARRLLTRNTRLPQLTSLFVAFCAGVGRNRRTIHPRAVRICDSHEGLVLSTRPQKVW